MGILKRFEVETKSHSGKSHGYRFVYGENEKEVILKMKKLKLPIFGIKEIKW